MSPVDRHAGNSEAWQRLRAQRRRAGQLRGRVVAISLIAFVLLWSIVFVQMATGNDPILGDSTSAPASRHRGSAAGDRPKPATPEAVETEPLEARPEPAEAEVEEAVEPEFEIPEPEPEPAPVITSQS
jgi:hypothetical protein